MSKTLLRFYDLLRCLQDVQCKNTFWVKSKCGLMMFFVCFLYVFSLLDAQPALQLRSSLSFQALCTLPPRVPNPPMTLPRVPEVKATGVQPKGSSTFCSVTRLQWFTLITRSYTNRKQTGSDCPTGFFFQQTCVKRS